MTRVIWKSIKDKVFFLSSEYFLLFFKKPLDAILYDSSCFCNLDFMFYSLFYHFWIWISSILTLACLIGMLQMTELP